MDVAVVFVVGVEAGERVAFGSWWDSRGEQSLAIRISTPLRLFCGLDSIALHKRLGTTVDPLVASSIQIQFAGNNGYSPDGPALDHDWRSCCDHDYWVHLWRGIERTARA